MKLTSLLPVSVLALVLVTCSSSSTPDVTVMDMPSYRIYISDLRNNVVAADVDSFAPGEQTALSDLSAQILTAVTDIGSFEELNDEQRAEVISLNEQLHVLMVGEDQSRARGRICRTEQNTGSNIRSRSCRTREQLTQDRMAVRDLLVDRADDLDRIQLGDQQSGGGGFGNPGI